MNHNNPSVFYRKRDSFFPFQFVFVGYLLVLFGIYLLIRLNPLGLLAIAGGLFFSFAHTGIQIDFEENKYREYLGVFQLKMGKWHPLPNLQYVTVFVGRYVEEMHMATISSTQTKSDYKINLIVSKTSRIEIGSYTDKTKAMNTGRYLAVQLQCKLLDYTSGNAVWVELNH